jgi:hypothetical protein
MLQVRLPHLLAGPVLLLCAALRESNYMWVHVSSYMWVHVLLLCAALCRQQTPHILDKTRAAAAAVPAS